MVSSSNIIFVGIALLAGVFLLRGSSLATTPAVTVADIQQEDPEIGFLQKILSSANTLLRQTFKDPILPKGLTTGGKTFPCRGPNCLGSQGAAGVRAAFDPFTGQRTVIGFTQRGSAKTQAFFGDISGNLTRILEGRQIQTNLIDFIADITNQLKIKQTNTV